MKTKRLINIAILAVALCAAPAYAQNRGGGGGGSRGGGSHSSASSSRSGGGHSSSSSRSGSSVSSPSSSRSSSPNRSSSSFSSPSTSHSSTPNRSSANMSSPSRSHDRGSMKGENRNGGIRNEGGSRVNSRSSVGTPSSTAPTRSVQQLPNRNGRLGDDRPVNRGGDIKGPGSSQVGRGSVNPQNSPGHSYARPGKPGAMPPSHRPMHPAPYFHHPHHHGMIHMHPIVWHPVPPRPLFWPGFWMYCNSYWYDYHVTDVVVVNRYVKDTYNVDMVSYAISGDLMYAIVNDNDGKTYMQVYDKNDKLLAEQEISKKYVKTEIDRENGGCWVFKKKDKDPMLFLYADGELLIYEAD